MDYIIEKGIPIPQPASPVKPKSPLRLLAEKMEVGDSAFIASGDKPRSRLFPFFSYVGKQLDRKFVLRDVEGGVRVWRAEQAGADTAPKERAAS